jgi:hypothetical protein
LSYGRTAIHVDGGTGEDTWLVSRARAETGQKTATNGRAGWAVSLWAAAQPPYVQHQETDYHENPHRANGVDRQGQPDFALGQVGLWFP